MNITPYVHKVAYYETDRMGAVTPIMTILGAAMWFLVLLCINYGGCLIWVEDGILYRRGFLFGHRRCCAVKDIQRFESVSSPRGGSWIYIVDSAPGCYENALKSCYICLEDTAANRAFIASFCGRVIRTYKHRYSHR